MMRIVNLVWLVAAGACTVTSGNTTTGEASSNSSSSGAPHSSSTGGADALAAGAVLMERLAGLWSGPATQTPLGDFALMNVDFRAVDDHAVFGRTDLDAENFLRFAFWIETPAGTDTWIYRNGGFFLGRLRDTRTQLVEHNEQAGTWRFCAVNGGCAYVDALYDFDGDTALVFDVKVRGNQHVLWTASRLEPRTLPSPFPVDQTSLGTGTADFPDMATLQVTLTWTTALTQPADAWLLVTQENCSPTGTCHVSRSIRAEAAAGAQSAVLTLPQMHHGSYKLTAVLDRNQNMENTLRPDAPDGVSIPNAAVTVGATGTTTSTVSIFINP